MSCGEFRKQVRHRFGYLFAEYGFSIVHTDQAETRTNHCLIVLESIDCRVKMYRTWEVFHLLFGAKSAPAGWGGPESGAWFYLPTILDYFAQEDIDLETMLKRGTTRGVEAQMAEESKRLEPECARVIALFSERDPHLKMEDFLEWNRCRKRRISEQAQSMTNRSRC